MPYKYLEEIATADIAFSAWHAELSKLFIASSQATLNILIEDISVIHPALTKKVCIEESHLDLLLYRFLEKIVFYKDAENLLLCANQVSISKEEGAYLLEATFVGEKIDIEKHALYLDIKAITMHQLNVEKVDALWKALVVVDV